MLLHVLAVGDIVAQPGLAFFCRHIRALKRLHAVHFTVVNGENAAGMGITPANAKELLAAGADVITLGNHTWGRAKIADFMEETPFLLRPANYPERLPGRGWGVFSGPTGLRIGVVNLIGRVAMDPNVDSPFSTIDRVLDQMETDLVLVDFHAEATSEKQAMGWYLDGRASAVWGTHTHVPTADPKILPRGTGYVTDLGMTGPANSVIGIQPELSLNRFLGGMPRRYEPADGPCQMNAVLFTIDERTRACVGVERLDLTD